MALEHKLDARQIVMEAGMSARPEFYSGRGAISCDLNDGHLEKIFECVKSYHGDDAAHNYVQMVADIPKLTATDFLLTLYSLEASEWKWEKDAHSKTKGLYVDGENDEQKLLSGMGTIFSVLGGMSKRDETHHIRSEFLRRHGIEQKQNPYNREW